MVNRKLHIILFRLASSLSSSMTLNKVDDLERPRTARNFAWFRRFGGGRQRSNEWRRTSIVSDRIEYPTKCTVQRCIDWITLTFCWAFFRYRFAIRIQWVKWRFSTYIREMYAKYISQMTSNTVVVTTIIENRIFMICCWPTFLRYRAIIHALLLRAYLCASAISCYFRTQHSRAVCRRSV